MTELATVWLRDLDSVWTPPENQFSGARGHQAAIQTKLDADLGVLGMFEIGSVRHGTGVRQYSSADYLVSLKGAKPASPWTALDNVKDALQTRFPGSTMMIRRPKVVCCFSDGDVGIVPGYSADHGYSIPDPILGWLKTDPSKHTDYIDEVNKKFDGAAKKLARQLKIWKYRHDVPVSSCYLEMHAVRHIEEATSYLPVVDLCLALQNLQSATLGAMDDPTGAGPPIPATSSKSSKAEALSKVETAITRVRRAKEYVNAGNHAKATAELKLLFGV